MKTLDLVSCLRRDPKEFVDRVSTIFSAQWESSFGGPPVYQTVGAEEGMQCLFEKMELDVEDVLAEPGLRDVEERVSARQAELPSNAPFATAHNGDRLLGRLCYAVTRALRPRIVAETGVCYGVTSACILAALEVNGQGHLYSIDLPPLGKNGDRFVGWLVPENLKHRWTLHRGTSRRLLGPLVDGLGCIDVFVHDSLHTYENMKSEFETVWPALRADGVLISDDVEGNSAFLQLTRQVKAKHSLVIEEKGKTALLGVARKGE